MSRPGITYQEVANAAIYLQGKDSYPTVDKVREVLGTGSKSTIARYLKEWKASTGQETNTGSLPASLIAVVKGLWDKLSCEADAKIELYQQEANQIITDIKQSLAAEQKQNSDLLTKIHQLEDLLAQEKHQSKNLSFTLEEEKRLSIRLTERNERLSLQLADQKNETEKLHQLLSHVQANLEHYQASIQKLREEQTLSTEKQKAIHLQELQALKQDIAKANEQKNLAQYHNEHLQAKIHLLQDQHDTLQKEHKQLYLQLQDKTVKESTLHYQCEQLTQTCQKQQETNTQYTKTITEQEMQLALLTDQLKSTHKALQTAQDTIQLLRNEKLFLIQEKAQLQGQLKQLKQLQATL